MITFLNTASPIITIVSISIITVIILISKKVEREYPLAILIFAIIGILVYHSVFLESLASTESTMISRTYHCIVVDLILLLVTFVSYLWIDDIIAKKKKLKSYDDSLGWFWNKL